MHYRVIHSLFLLIYSTVDAIFFCSFVACFDHRFGPEWCQGRFATVVFRIQFNRVWPYNRIFRWSLFTQVSYLKKNWMLFACFESLMHRIIIIIGLVCWSLVTLGGSFANSFEGLLAARCFSGLGEAVFGSLCPAIISDLFTGVNRTRMLTLYFLSSILGG